MIKILKSVPFGNWKGYEGTKAEIQIMLNRCFKECNHAGIEDLGYVKKNIDKNKPGDNGLYQIEYWSKW